MSYLVDTNILSEPRQRHPNIRVLNWLEAHESALYTSVLVAGEIRYGIERLPQSSARRASLLNWYKKMLDVMAGRVLSVNVRVAEEWARLQAEMHAKGVVLPMVDSLLAATARRYQLVLVTDNVADFDETGVRIFNPFEHGEAPADD